MLKRLPAVVSIAKKKKVVECGEMHEERTVTGTRYFTALQHAPKDARRLSGVARNPCSHAGAAGRGYCG
jgi:hypothetical protein